MPPHNSRWLTGKQITARIRRAKGSKDPVGQLCNLFQKTRDAMVAFELARHLETVNLPDDAVKWYAISWQRFRRGDWKTKAEEGVARLGGTLPAAGEVLPVPEVPPSAATDSLAAEDSSEAAESGGALLIRNLLMLLPPTPTLQMLRPLPPTPQSQSMLAVAVVEVAATAANRLLHLPQRQPFVIQLSQPSLLQWKSPRARRGQPLHSASPVEPAAESSGPGVKGRFGDPGLSSRISLLECSFAVC